MRENHDKDRPHKDQINVTSTSMKVSAQLKNLEGQIDELTSAVAKHTILLTHIQTIFDAYLAHQTAGEIRLHIDAQARTDRLESLVIAQSTQITTLIHQMATLTLRVIDLQHPDIEIQQNRKQRLECSPLDPDYYGHHADCCVKISHPKKRA